MFIIYFVAHVISLSVVMLLSLFCLLKNPFARYSFWMEHPTKPLYDFTFAETSRLAAK